MFFCWFFSIDAAEEGGNNFDIFNPLKDAEVNSLNIVTGLFKDIFWHVFMFHGPIHEKELEIAFSVDSLQVNSLLKYSIEHEIAGNILIHNSLLRY